MTRDLDAEIDEILAKHAARKRAAAQAAEPGSMYELLAKVFARAEREHRRATERVEIKVFEC